MTRIFCAVEQDRALVGDFALVADVDLLGDVDALKQRLKAWSADLAGIELRHMTVFGVWAAKPKVAAWTATLANGDAALAPNVNLSSLINATGDYFVIVRITDAITAPPPTAAAGASVLGWDDACFRSKLLPVWCARAHMT